ncbi:flavodoxin family protein [Haloplasma contractile]|uniref:Multimeric flavodoxin WrbA family protein n=1 Tax=Haloplasma contractile SSD-17B TaxID=1033810 RepID=U2EAD6_9MOLU|nr:flavodoxin family protein [Haloplasma contractile]ERJ12058.1 Multimeric flavodoxin WrbA family protein [Haloplasma contractile SSD-17B]
MILILNGSPNKYGNTKKVMNEVIKDIDEEVIEINAYEDKIAPCIDCKFCSHKSGCSIKDRGLDLYELIEKADKLIVASPLYFATLSGELVKLLSRFQTYYAGKYVRKIVNPSFKKAVLIVTAGGNWPTMFVGVQETFKVLSYIFYFEDNKKELLIPNCDERSPIQDESVLEEMKQLRAFLID